MSVQPNPLRVHLAIEHADRTIRAVCNEVNAHRMTFAAERVTCARCKRHMRWNVQGGAA